MEAVEELLKNFGKSWKERSIEATVRALKDIPGYVKILSYKNGGRVLEILLDEKQGLLQFIHTIFNYMENYEINNFKTALKEAFADLQILIKLFKNDYEPYVQKTREVCFTCIKSKSWFYTRRAASETYQKLIEYYLHHDLQLDLLIEHFHTAYYKYYDRKEGCVFYLLIGAIAKYCPMKSEELIRNIDDVYVILLDDLKYQCMTCNNKSHEEMKIYLNCYIDMLQSFTPFADDHIKKSEYLKKMFTQVSDICFSDEMAKNIKNKTMYLLSVHMSFFTNLIFDDFKKWHNLFTKCLAEKEIHVNIGVLRHFYANMACHMIELDDEIVIPAFEYFKAHMTSNLDNKNLSFHQMKVLIYGLGEFSCLYRKYASADMHDLFQKITIIALPYYAREKEGEDDYEIISEFLRALAQIIRFMPDVANYHLSVIVDLSLFFIKIYAESKKENKSYAISTLKSAFRHIHFLEPHYQREFFNSFFREGILKACSHTLLIDAEIEVELENLNEKPITYKNYIPLWNDLFKIDNEDTLVNQMFNDLLSVLFSFIDSLNLNVTSSDDETLSGSSFSLKAENESDFVFFINLVDLHLEIFNEIDSSLLQESIEKLLDYFIKCSYKHQMISGFYKIIEVVFKKPDVFADYEITFDKATCELIPQYLSDVLKLVSGYSGELQLSCIYMIFSAPVLFIKNLIEEMSSIFKIAFHMGLTDISIAYCALNTLEEWIKSMEYRYPVDFIKNIICYLEPYLSSEETTTETFRGRYLKNNTANDESLEDFQKRILLFYGSLTQTEILFDYVHEKSNQTNATWTKKNDLQCDLLFPDIRLEINFDTILPRIIDLTKSGDLRVKISACELLHTMITIIIGKKLTDQCFDKNLCRELLRLGCDLDDAVRNIYHPFVIQLIHYLSSKLMKNSRVPQYFVDSLFDGLTEDYRSSMRDYCGFYLKEFVEWSMRQSIDNDTINVRAIVRRITSFALFPSNKKRLAASIAFNNLYVVLRENTMIVNDYWLEFFYAFVKSMDDCDDAQTSKALDHVEKVIIVKQNVFKAKSPSRRKPPGFTDETLNGALLWLFDQCGTLNAKCRKRCMIMFENLISLLSTSDVAKIFNTAKINDVALTMIDNDFVALTSRRAKIFSKCLNFYGWIITKKLLPVDINEIIGEFTDNNVDLLRYVERAVTSIVETNIKDNATTHKEIDEIVKAINEFTSEIVNFLLIILNSDDNCVNSALWSDNVFLLIVYCLIEPSKIELTAKNLQIIEKLPEQLERILKLMGQKLTTVQLSRFKDCFVKRASAYFTQYAEITEIINHKRVHDLKQFVDGLIVLKKCDVFDFKQKFNIDYEFIKIKLKTLFESLKTRILNRKTCRTIDDHVLEYMNGLLKFFLDNCDNDVIGLLVEFIMNDTSLTKSDGTRMSHGEYFLEKFKAPILKFMLEDPRDTLKVLDEFLKKRINSVRIFYVVDELLIFAQRHRQSYSVKSEILSDEVIARFSLFSEYLNNMENRKTMFFNINKRAVQLKNDPTTALKTNGAINDFRSWLFMELTTGNDKDMEKKIMILQNFTACLINDDSVDKHREYLMILYQLRDNDSAELAKKLDNDQVLKHHTSLCLRTLLKLNDRMKSTTIYEGIVRYAAGIYKCLSNVSVVDNLRAYFCNLTENKALKSLQIVYKIFMTLTPIRERLDVLKLFLLPSMDLCRSRVIAKFYQDKHEEMLDRVRMNMNFISNDKSDREKLIVTQIGCYGMFELMFAKHEPEPVDLRDPINRSNQMPINRILIKQIIDLRSYEARNDDEKEITRLLQCAAVNCSITLISQKKEEKFYKFVFFTNVNNNQLLWERIIDLGRDYDLTRSSTSYVRDERKKLLNIKRAVKTTPFDRNDDNTASYYFRRYDLASLSLLENINAYDLNDAFVNQKSTNDDDDNRIDLSFENDELNDHECMSMLVGVIIHMYNSDIVKLPTNDENVDDDENDDEKKRLPEFLEALRLGFLTKHNNVRLFLLRLICNAKIVFIRHIDQFFIPICEAVCAYLSTRNLNYVIRDILVLIVESNHATTTNDEKLITRRLLRNLIPRLVEQPYPVYRYNVELFESLCRLYAEQLNDCPDTLSEAMKNTPELAVQVIVIFLRNNVGFDLLSRNDARKLIGESIRDHSGSEQIVLMSFEATGWLMKRATNDDNKQRLIAIFEQIRNKNQGLCAKCVSALYRGCRCEIKCKDYFKYARPGDLNDEHKACCLELFIRRIPDIEPSQLSIELTLTNVRSILSDRVLGCEEHVLKIISKIVPSLPPSELIVYLNLVVTGFTGLQKSLIEHRRLAYNVLADAYNAHGDVNDKIAALCVKSLVRALVDPADVIQQFAIEFWRERVRLPVTCCERVIETLRFYTPEAHDAFARFFCVVVLESTRKSTGDKRVMFQSLADCNYRDYEILIPRRRLNLGTMAPLFVPSLANQINQFNMTRTRTLLNGGGGTFINEGGNSLRLAATKDSSFQSTFQFAVPRDVRTQINVLPDPSKNRLSKRTLSVNNEQNKISRYHRDDDNGDDEQSRKRNDFHDKLKNENDNDRNNVKIYRKYRIGDFPDVEITHATFVESLRRFIMNDWSACNNFAIILVDSLLEQLKFSDKYRLLIDYLSSFLKRMIYRDNVMKNDFLPVILEIVLRAKDIKINPNVVGKLCNSMELYSLGIMLLEEDGIVCDDDDNDEQIYPPNKRRKFDVIAGKKEKLLQLAGLYKSIGMTDVVSSIFRQPDVFADKLREAALAQLEGKWTKASQAYRSVYESIDDDVTSAEREHCLDGEFESLAQLGCWDKINDRTKSILRDDYENVWNDTRMNRLLPWIFDAQLQAALISFTSDEEPDNRDFIINFGNWLSEREIEMKRRHGEEIAMFFLCGSVPEEKARHALKCRIEQIRDNWMRLSTLSENPRLKMLQQLRAIFNIASYVKAIEITDCGRIEDEANDLLKYWNRHVPNLTDDLLSWNKLVTYRLSFIHLLHEKIENASQDSDILNDLIASGVRQRMRSSELAIINNNTSITKDNLKKIEPIIEQIEKIDKTLVEEFELSASKYKFINRSSAASIKKRFDYYLSSWKVTENLIGRDDIDVTVSINSKHHIFELTSALSNEAKNNERVLELLTNDEFVNETVASYRYPTILDALNDYSFGKLEESCFMGTERDRGLSFAKFGKHCYDLSQRDSTTCDNKLNKHFVSSILQGMIFGSSEAARYFPCLLKNKLYDDNDDLKATFLTKIENVPCWMFLTSKDQIVSYLSDPNLNDLLLPIVTRIFADYPYAIIYDYEQLMKNIGSNADSAFCREFVDFFNRKGIKQLIEGLHHVCQPELYLKHKLLDLIDGNCSRDDVDDLLEKLYVDETNNLQFQRQGAIYKIVLNRHKESLEKLKGTSVDATKRYAQQICNNLQNEMKKRINDGRRQALQLKDYSPHLAYFTGDERDIELPGQYDGNKKPLIQYHVKIAKFDRYVRVMDSKCNPIKINVIGNDARNHNYLVKCGEDLRQDQRLQQIFKTINKTLELDINCRQRYLAIDTYHVLPLSSNLGLIQWVDDTKSLKEFVEFTMKDKLIVNKLHEEYDNWMQKAGKSKQISAYYRDALIKYSAKEVTAKMNKLIGQLGNDHLRRTFLTISPSLDCYVSLRHNFITSYATMSLIHWLTGVGDRHLDNLLIKVKSGNCCGIDYGLAFGTGIEQSPPELVPFRLTSQILGLLRPFDETGLFGITMTHVLVALRKEHGPLSACLDVFIHEPLNWSQKINKNIDDVLDEQQHAEWIPQNKIGIVKKKLNGMNPSTVMFEELSRVHCRSRETDECYSKYETIVYGKDNPSSVRSKLGNENLKPEEQVQCLLEQAKDLNLLGRMYVGWSPFV